MNKFETFDDNKLNHVINGPDYGQNCLICKNNLNWTIEDSLKYQYSVDFYNNGVIIEPVIYIDMD